MATQTIRLLWVFPSFKIGGAQSRFATLAGALGDDYEHAVIALDGDYEAERLIPSSAVWRRVELPPKKKAGVSLGSMWRFRRTLAKERPHLVITSNWGSLEWLLVNRGPGSAPHIHFEDGIGTEESLDDLDTSRSWARRRAFPGKSRRFVAASGAVREAFVNDWGAPDELVEMIPNGVDLSAFAPIERDPARSPVRIGSVGAFRPEKRFDRLLRMVATLRARGRAVEAMLVGDGPERGALEALTKELDLGSAVHFVGAQANIPAYLEQMDIYAMTSDVEQAPRSVVEAMACGLPAVATEVGDVPEMLSKANRVFVRPPEDESGLAAAAELLAIDPETRAEVGAQNAARAEARFSLEGMAARYDSLFRDVASVSTVLMLPAPA